MTTARQLPLLALVALLSCGLAACCGAPEPPAKLEPEATAPTRLRAPSRPNPVIAHVDGEKIYAARVDAEFRRALKLRERAGVPASTRWRDRKRQSILNELIADALVRRAMKDGNVVVTEAEVDARIQKKIETTFRSRRALDQHLAKLGRTTADYRDQTRVELGVEKLAPDPRACEATDEELRALYDARKTRFKARERVKLSVVFLRVAPGTGAEGRALMARRAKSLAAAARSGKEPFEDLARRHSDGPTAAAGGALGWVFANNLDPKVAAKVFRAPVGTITEPISTRLGFQIVRVEDRRAAGVRGFDEVREALAAQIAARKLRDLRAQVVADLRRRYPVTVTPEPRDSTPRTLPGSSK